MALVQIVVEQFFVVANTTERNVRKHFAGIDWWYRSQEETGISSYTLRFQYLTWSRFLSASKTDSSALYIATNRDQKRS